VDALFERPDGLYAGLVLLVVLIPRVRLRALGAAGLVLVLLGAASNRVGGPSSGTTFATVNEVLIVLGAVIVLGAAGVAVVRAGSARDSASSRLAPQSPAPNSHPLLFIGLTLALAAPHLVVVELGILLALVAAVRDTLREKRLVWLAVLILGAGMLGAAFVVATTILGPEGGRITALAEGPFSPAAERMLVMLIGAGTLLLAGLPPLHGSPWGLGLAPLTAIMLGRIVLPAFPGGALEWQPMAMLLCAGAGISAALTRRWAALATAAGLAVLWSGIPSGVLAAGVLVLWGWLLDLVDRGGRPRMSKLPERWSGLVMLVPALAALPALAAALGAQVVIPVVFTAGVMAASIRELVRRSGRAPPPLY